MGKKADIVRRIERDGCGFIGCGECPMHYYGGTLAFCKAGEASFGFSWEKSPVIKAQATEWLAKRAERKAKKCKDDHKSQWDGKFVPGRLYASGAGLIVMATEDRPIGIDCFSGISNRSHIENDWVKKSFKPATAADLIRAGMIEE